MGTPFDWKEAEYSRSESRKLEFQASEPQFFAHHHDCDSSRMTGTACDDYLTADGFGTLAVGAQAGSCAGRFQAETHTVGRSGSRLDAIHRFLDGFDCFIHSGNDDDMCRSIDQTGDAVAIAVNVH